MQNQRALKNTPPIWLIVLIVGLPQLSETVYTPSLPDIARTLQTAASMVEYTLTIYLFGMALGILYWGKLSDSLGRKPCILAGFLTFILGCVGCYVSTSIMMLMMSRFVQAFGGSVGSVLGQALCRDSFCGPELFRVYASMSTALAAFPAFGPIVGGLIADNLGWVNIFLFLILFGLCVGFLIVTMLPETHDVASRVKVSISDVFTSMIFNKRLMGLTLLVGAGNGMVFSYFAEGSFVLIDLLGMSASYYGMSFVLIATATMLGAITSKKLHSHIDSMVIVKMGINAVFCSTLLFSIITICSQYWNFNPLFLIVMIIGLHMINAFGICLIISNALAAALVDYRHCIGTASSLFGFMYMVGTSLTTFGMGMLHNGTLFSMPFYFFSIAVFMQIVYFFSISRDKKCIVFAN